VIGQFVDLFTGFREDNADVDVRDMFFQSRRALRCEMVTRPFIGGESTIDAEQCNSRAVAGICDGVTIGFHKFFGVALTEATLQIVPTRP
jgi:hypothetical protein